MLPALPAASVIHLAHVRWRPPSIGIVSPVIQLARSDARNRIMPTTSSGCPGRPRGCVVLERSRNAAYCASSMPELRCRFVTVTPGFTRVHADAEGRHLERGTSSQLINRRFADAVREHAWKRPQAVHARYVDDGAFALGEVRSSGTHQSKRRTQVDGHHLVPVRVGRGLDGPGRDHSGRIHDNVNGAEAVDRGSHDTLRRIVSRHISRARSRATSTIRDALSDLVQNVLTTPDEHNRGSVACECFRCGAPDTARRARHDHGFSRPIHEQKCNLYGESVMRRAQPGERFSSNLSDSLGKAFAFMSDTTHAFTAGHRDVHPA